jgi:peptide/nickel transport system permease protein
MTRFVLNRLLQAAIVVFLLATVVFFMGRLVGDPTILYVGEYGSQEDILRMREYLGLDKPLIEQYAMFLRNALRGNLGYSFMYRQPTLKLFAEYLPATTKLCGLALLLSIVFGLLAGILAAAKRGSFVDYLVGGFGLFGQAMPPFVIALLLILLFAVQLKLFPITGYGGIRYLVLPATALSWFFIACVARLLRGSMIETLGKDYIRLARIKGLREREVILKHALKNSIIPVVTYVGPLAVVLVTSALAVEVVFGWPGIGQLANYATLNRDLPMVQTIVIILAAAMVLINLVVDVLYAWIDPRIRFWEAKH